MHDSVVVCEVRQLVETPLFDGQGSALYQARAADRSALEIPDRIHMFLRPAIVTCLSAGRITPWYFWPESELVAQGLVWRAVQGKLNCSYDKAPLVSLT